MKTPLLALGCLVALIAATQPGCTAESEAEGAAAALQSTIDDPHATPEQRAEAARALAEFNALKVSADHQGAADTGLINTVTSAVGGTVPFAGIIAAVGGALWQGFRRDSTFRKWVAKGKGAASSGANA